ncbi:cellulase family glycosylhydrolase [Microbacterium sp. MC2]
MRVRKWQWVTGGAVVVALGAAAVGIALAASGGAEPEVAPDTPTPTVTPTPTPTPTPVAMPSSVAAIGDLGSWAQAPTTKIARVLPQVGDAASGSVAAYVDAPVVDGETTALEVEAEVVAGQSYDFSAQMRVLSPLPTDVAASVMIGDRRIELPELDAEWDTVIGSFVAPADATTTSVRIVLDGPVSGLGVDDVTLVPADGGDNVIPNPSFEKVNGGDVILNRTLILPADEPLLAVRMPEGAATWQAANDAGDVVARGSAEVTRAVDAFELEGLEQGYYTLTVTDSAGDAVSTKLGLIDYAGDAVPVDPRFGVGLHVERDWYDDAADLANTLGLGLARNDILWRHNETTKGEYRWDKRYADGFDRLHAHGIHLLGIVNYGNKLYGSERTPDTPAAIAAYGRYAAAIADRFDLIGLEVFNEFNHDRFNKTGCGTDPSCYVPLLQSVEKEVRKIDPDLPLVAGSTARYDADWFDGLWRDGGLEYSDVVSFHPYEVSGNPESLAGIIATANKSMQTHGGDTRPIWITELGTSSKTGGRTVNAQADYLVRTSITAFANGVEKFFWYDLVNDSPDPDVHEGNFGMYYQKKPGVAALQPKPVGYAQALMITQLGGREYLDKETLADGVLSYRFGTADDAMRVAWAPGGDTTVEIPSDEPITLVRMSGATAVVSPVDGVVTVTLGARPTFLAPAGAPPAVSQTPAP